MGEIILTAITEEVVGKLFSLASQEIGLAWGVKSELNKLNNTLSAINAVLLDAERQQTKSLAVKDWLEKLKDVVYDMDDVLDDFQTEALKKTVKTRWGMLKEVRNFFSKSNPFAYRLKMGHTMKGIRERLDAIESNRKFQLSTHVGEPQIQTRKETHSFVEESEVIGRDKDNHNIVKLIMANNKQANLSVIPIVGFGGLGKTTLAKLVYNDEDIAQSYGIRLWVCVSEDSELSRLLKKIIKAATSESCEGLDLEQLQVKIRGILYAKKFFLVLDDIWNDDPKWWAELRELLVGGAVGSTIIVTTRSLKIGSIVGTIESYHLGGLPLEDCSSLFFKCAFKEGKEREHPKLMKIGKEIVQKCGGVPLAVKTLGSLLYMQTDVGEWLNIKNNDIWELEQGENDILPALRLSYERMPSYLKQCFAYCSIFPKDYDILKDELIYLWMAQGLLQSRDKNQRLEDIGNRYINELLSRSFFQDVEITFDNLVDVFKMHDLVHDLARSVVGKEFFDADIGSSAIPENVRHLIFDGDDLSNKEFPKSLVFAKKVRSLAFSLSTGPISQTFLDTIIMSFLCLRVLDLSWSTFEVLPSFISKLKHLRYLDLSGNDRLKALPNSICKLLNLLFLDLYGCDQLQDLPRDIGTLTSLRYLAITSQGVSMPENGLRCLTSLQSLWISKCNRLESLPNGIQHLTALRELRITKCSRLTSLSNGMKGLAALELLLIFGCPELELSEGEDLSGLRSLRSLDISGLPKLVALPHGLVQSASTLQYLSIDNCTGLTALPEWLGNLTSLEVLYIENCPNLLSLPEGMQSLTALQELSIIGCPHLIKRCEMESGEDWPKISHVPEIILI